MSDQAPARKGATRAADIPPELLQALSRGEAASATLTEALALDQRQLARSALPELSATALARIDAACQLGILKRMQAVADALLTALSLTGGEINPVQRVR